MNELNMVKGELAQKKETENKDIKKKSNEKKDDVREPNEQEDRRSTVDENKKVTYASKAAVKPKDTCKAKNDLGKHVPCNILIVADSHSKNLDKRVLENATNSKVDMATAYTVDEDHDAYYRNKNFLTIVPQKLKQRKYDTLILQGGCNEISNVKISPRPQPEQVKQWEDKIQKSRSKMFRLAEDSLRNNPELKKVIILKSPPRYDSPAVDPCSIKAKLNEFGNTLYTNMWMEKGCPNDISIEDQHFECHGPLREKRYGNPDYVGYDGKPWDGIHMRGRLAVTHYTNSIIRILSGSIPPVHDMRKSNFHQSCPQTQYQNRNQYRHKGAANYQNNYARNQTHQERDSHGENREKVGSYSEGYNVRVSNRFNHLNY